MTYGTIFINQGDRPCVTVEENEHYSLVVYTMPEGRASLLRIIKADGRFSRPTKKEREKHAKAILEQALEASYEREDRAENMRDGWKRRLKLKGILEDRAKIEAKLKVLNELAEAPNPELRYP